MTNTITISYSGCNHFTPSASVSSQSVTYVINEPSDEEAYEDFFDLRTLFTTIDSCPLTYERVLSSPVSSDIEDMVDVTVGDITDGYYVDEDG